MFNPNASENFESQLSYRQDLTFKSLNQVLADHQLPAAQTPAQLLGLGQFSNLDLLLSDQCPYSIKCGVFKGVTQDEFLDRQEFTGSLAAQFAAVYRFIDQHNPVKSQIKGLYREDQRTYPPQAIREALMNCIIHRDYSNPASTLINVYADRIEFISYGGLADGITEADVKLGLSVCRNPHLAQFFYRLKLVESYGTGLARIKSAYKGAADQPVIIPAPASFKVVLPAYQLKSVKLKPKAKAKPQPATRPARPKAAKSAAPAGNEQAVLAFGQDHAEFIRSDIEKLLGVSPATATRLLRQMEGKGLITKRGKAKAIRYRITE